MILLITRKEPLTCKVYLALVFGLLGVFLLADPEEIIYDHTFSKEKLYGLGAGIDILISE